MKGLNKYEESVRNLPEERTFDRINPTFIYNGAAEEYEDLADIVAVPARLLPKGVRIA